MKASYPNNTVRAAAIERRGRVHVLSTATGRARRFDFSVATWDVRGSSRALAIAQRVEHELRRFGVRAETTAIRIGGVA